MIMHEGDKTTQLESWYEACNINTFTLLSEVAWAVKGEFSHICLGFLLPVLRDCQNLKYKWQAEPTL